MSLLRRLPLPWTILPLSLSRTYAYTPTPSPPVPHLQPDSSSPEGLQQSPNVPSTWSTSQNPKPHAYDNARFEQIDLTLQPNAPAAMGMSKLDPVRLVLGRRATCDGGESILLPAGGWTMPDRVEVDEE